MVCINSNGNNPDSFLLLFTICIMRTYINIQTFSNKVHKFMYRNYNFMGFWVCSRMVNHRNKLIFIALKTGFPFIIQMKLFKFLIFFIKPTIIPFYIVKQSKNSNKKLFPHKTSHIIWFMWSPHFHWEFYHCERVSFSGIILFIWI